MTEQERAMQRAKKPSFHPLRAWNGTNNQAKETEEKAKRVAPLHSRVIR